MRKLMSTKLFFAVAAFLMVLSPLQIASVSAATNPTYQQVTPIEIEPVCSNATTNEAFWKVTNKNAFDVSLQWTNTFTNVSNSFNALPGVSSMITNYDATDANNRTVFDVQDNTSPSSTNVTKAACTPVTPPVVTPACIDGKQHANLVVRYTSNNTVTVTPLNNQPLCDDVEIFLSAYEMPDTYDGQGFNSTAIPQTLFGTSSRAVLAKGSTATQTLTVALPNPCKNTQIDVYYGPEITAVTTLNGHGTQNLLSQVYRSTGACAVVTPPVTTTPVTPTPGGKGGGTTPIVAQPVAPVTPTAAKTPAELPSELPKTGSNMLALLLIIPLLIGALSYKGALEYQTRRN